MSAIIKISSILQLHKTLNLSAPKHDLVTLIPISNLEVRQELVGVKVVKNLYCVALLDEDCNYKLEYGKMAYDFNRGSLLFLAPHQVITFTKTLKKDKRKGWLFCFHPDLLLKASLNQKMHQYSFLTTMLMRP